MLNIITCFEAGIEDKCIALYRSIDRFVSFEGGVRVFGVMPRHGHEPSRAALVEAERLNVEYIQEDLNTEFSYYPLANKPLSCAHIVDKCSGGPFLFLDSDTLFLSHTDISCLKNSGLSLRPVDTPNVGATSFDAPNGAYWKALYTELGVTKPRKVVPATTANEIFEYYNSGFVYVEDGNVIRQWNYLFASLMRKSIRPNEGLFFVEQSALAAVITASKIAVCVPPSDFNYPIHLHESLLPKAKIEDAASIRHIHYHHIFQDSSLRLQRLTALGFGEKTDDIMKMLDWPSA